MISFIVFSPLVAASIAGLFSRVIGNSRAQLVTVGGLILSALLSAVVFYDVVIMKQPFVADMARWIDVGTFQASWSLKVDSLTAVMLVVVTWVSALVHVYSIGYMSHDPHVPRFMAYLSLFTFFMLMLVTSDNFIQLFLGWEGVGLCSYLLVGFWYRRESANAAAMKAFLVNRVGDFGFALGIFTIYMVFDSVVFSEVFSNVADYKNDAIGFLGYEINALTVICLLLFIGAMGKSAQLGLHTWLPDAMEGPTPVSALIHAATMVTAGVFLVARCSPLFEHSPVALSVVAVVGGATAIFAASVAITQNDIKKVIAYSTCSQLGYMFFACGVSAYSAAVFHLMTHAFFKALLFLGAGSVIHAMSDEQDMRYMGGIWKKIPFTYAMMWIGSLALVGVFPLAGFYSKDIILESAYVSGDIGRLVFWIGIFAAFLTAFYSWRLIIKTFHGHSRADDEVMRKVHESPAVMLVPLAVLAVGAVFSGMVGYYVLDMVGYSGAFWNGAIDVMAENNPLERAHHVSLIVKLSPLIVGVAGITAAYALYMFFPGLPKRFSIVFKPIYIFLSRKWFFDELYNAAFVRPSRAIGVMLWKFFDVVCIDGGGPNGAAWLSRKLSRVVSASQNGYIYTYAFAILVGMAVLLAWGIYASVGFFGF